MRIAPMAHPEAVIVSGQARFTFLTDRLIRCEFSAYKIFEDGATQHIWFRNLPVAAFKRHETKTKLVLQTAALRLEYIKGRPFTRHTLQIVLRQSGRVWRFGDEDGGNLRGAARTLDNFDGDRNMKTGERMELSNGLLSRNGWAVLDDSGTAVFGNDGLLEPRSDLSCIDFYFFGYGGAYAECLNDYYRIAGKSPLPPRWALGLWWSRWEKYSQKDITSIMGEFAAHGVPLSVCVIDMDWHIGKNPYTSGWTGYTWNRELFPDPRGFLRHLHTQDVHVCLNLHPGDGIHPHEDAYRKFAKFMGIDPDGKKPIIFDLADRRFIEGYFRFLHHPLEAQGVDFWWMDWQQGTTCTLENVDPLWYLNHLHATDLARDGRRRPFMFSRWGGHGSHRYPIGFSGDTCSTWATLRFLPYFTATSANIGYGWWSHDTGGFARGLHNDHELFVRWNQFACFSPIYRIHCCGDPTLDYRPWSKPAEYRDAILSAMRLRRELLPYLYTAAERNHRGGLPLLRPMYHDYPYAEEAYCCPQQYMFGPDMIAAPFTSAAEPDVGLSRQTVWLPSGAWFDFFNGDRYEGGHWHAVYGGLNHIPVFVREGSAIPLQKEDAVEWLVFPGEGTAELFLDDGATTACRDGDYARLKLTTCIAGKRARLDLRQTEGKGPTPGSVRIRLRGLCRGEDDGDYVLAKLLRIGHPLEQAMGKWRHRSSAMTADRFRALLRNFRITGHLGRPLWNKAEEIVRDPQAIHPYLCDLSTNQKRCMAELLFDAGFHAEPLPEGGSALCTWNPRRAAGFHAYVAERRIYDYRSYKLSGNDLLRIEHKTPFDRWEALVQYAGIASYTVVSR